MANMTDLLKAELLDTLLSVGVYTFPATTYVSLHTADPSDTGSVANELSGNGYNRVALTGKFTTTNGIAGVSPNTTQINFGSATGDWLAVTHIGIHVGGTPSTDDMLLYGALAGSITILNTETFSFLVGDLSLTLD